MKDNYIIAIVVIIILSGIFIMDSLEMINQDYTYYKKDYTENFILIKKESNNYYWDAIEKSVVGNSENDNIAIEVLDESKTNLISQNELLELAVISKPGGIIISGFDSPAMEENLLEASEENIPIVFINDEGTNALRDAYVGPNNYQRGQMAIQELKNNDKEYNVLIVDEYGVEERNLVIEGMISEINNHENINLSMIQASSDYRFDLSNNIREVVSQNPEINVIIGTSIYHGSSIAKLIIEMNKVGAIDIIAFDGSKETLNFIKRGVIEATLFTDGETIGKEAINTLKTIVSDDISLDAYYVPTVVVNKENVDDYIVGEDNE
jgi:ribose transport system substrate-binding protein